MSRLDDTTFQLPRLRVTLRSRRPLFRCWHRGKRESDFILGGFSDVISRILAEHSSTVEALIEFTDPDLFDWFEIAAPEEHDRDVMVAATVCSAPDQEN